MSTGLALLLCLSALPTTARPFDTVPPGPIPAFPGAEGAGAFAVGGRGGTVFTVTTLADSGPGSLRAAVEADGPRTVVFAVAGTIRLESPLRIHNDFITIAGQTAPGAGVALRDQPLIVAASHVVVRHLRVRLGDIAGVEADAISVADGQHIVLDHMSASWSVDETLSVSQRWRPGMKGLDAVTVQRSLIAESLNRSAHAKGEHGYGSLVRGSYGARFSFHRNLWAHHRSRMPRPGNFLPQAEDPAGAVMDFRNNVFYDWAGKAGGYNADTDAVTAYNFIANAYLPGPSSQGRLAFRESSPVARAFFAGNSMDGGLPDDPWSLVAGTLAPGYRQVAEIPAPPVTTVTAAEALEQVLAVAGASKVRDAVDERIVAQVRTRTGGLIDSQTQVGGWPDLPGGPAVPDGDGDGMPDGWEAAHGLDPADPADGARDRNGDGYTNLEDYLNGAALAGPVAP